jgi:hypothetical protein
VASLRLSCRAVGVRPWSTGFDRVRGMLILLAATAWQTSTTFPSVERPKNCRRRGRPPGMYRSRAGMTFDVGQLEI